MRSTMNLRLTKLCVASVSVVAFGWMISQCRPASAATLDSSLFNHKYEGGAVVNGYTAFGPFPGGADGGGSSANVSGNDILTYSFNGQGYYESTFWNEVNAGSHAFTAEWRQTVTTQGTLGFAVYGPDSQANGSPFVSVGSGDFKRYEVAAVPNDTHDNYPDFHVFRIAKASGSNVTQLWRDNIAVGSVANYGADAVSNLYWGSGSSGANSAGQLDYFRVDTTGAYEPTTVRTPAVITPVSTTSAPVLGLGSLIQLNAPTLSSQTPLANSNDLFGEPVGEATDGFLGSIGNVANSATFAANTELTYNLNLASHPQGYDLGSFVATTGFVDHGRVYQNYTLLYAKYDDLNTFYPITTVSTGPATDNWLQTTVTNLGATNVGAIRFRVGPLDGANSEVIYQELQLFDTSGPLPPPTVTYVPSASAPVLATGSLIQQGTVGSQSPTAASPDFFAEPVGEANDGLLGATNSVANSATFAPGTDLIYNLDLSTHPQGYDLDKFVATTGFVDHNRVAQSYTLSYAKFDDLINPTWIQLGVALSDFPASQDWLQSIISNLNATNAGAIRVHIGGLLGDSNSHVIYQEFQLFAVPEPGSCALLALAGIGLVIQRRSLKRTRSA